MSDDSKYVLDADVFIDAKNRYYAFNLAPKFWSDLILFGSKGRIQSIDRIKKQLEDGNDELAKWVRNGNMAEAFVTSAENDVIAAYREIGAWVQGNSQFVNAAKLTFAGDPDGWLIAYVYAKVKAKGNYILVTLETPKMAKTVVPIPNVCNAFGITYKNTFEMLLELGIRFE